MEDREIGIREQQMLELLADGATSRRMAETLGYRDGTMRVYLHHLYRKLGVANRSEAAVWFVNRTRDNLPKPAPARASKASGDLFGDAALAENLYTALGIMNHFVGPCGLVWEVGLRMRGKAMDAPLEERRERARALWRAFLRGDFAFGKQTYDEDLDRAKADPTNAVVLALLLRIGGFSSAADKLVSRIQDRRKNGPLPSARESLLLRSASAAAENGDMTGLSRLAADKASDPVKHLALCALFHLSRARRDPERARSAANVLWAEADTARKQLEAMGEKPFAAAPRSETPTARSTPKAKSASR